MTRFPLRLTITALAVAALAAPPARALNCDTNPGGPEEIQIVLDSGGSDMDIGWKQDAHNVGVPLGSSIRICLDNCDTTTDPACDILGTIEGISSGTTTIGPPLPIYVDNRFVPVCAVIQFPAPGVTGTANVSTGAISGSATINANVFLGECPQCSGATAGATGTCLGGAAPGAACTTEQITRVLHNPDDDSGTPHVDKDFKVSRECLPTGVSFTVSQAVSVATSSQMVSQPCPNQVAGTSGNHECGVAGCVNTCLDDPGANGGVAQNCCNNQTTACFPNTITRAGTAAVPAPTYPDLTYPKTSDITLAGAFCIGSINPLFVDNEIGAPGPMALLWPGSAMWRTDSDSDGLYDDLDVTCPFDADCDDDGLIDGALSGSEDLDEDGEVDPGETDPENFDSDGDGLPDGLEKGLGAPERPDATDMGAGHFIADLDPNTTTDPNDADTDGDGIDDGVEDANHNGRLDAGETDPNPPGPTTTTTTTLPGCGSPADCSDADACTQDLCTNMVCSNPPLGGVEGAVCAIDKAASAPRCAGTTLDPKLTKALDKGFQKASSTLAGIGDTTGKKRVKALKKAKKALSIVLKKVGKAAKNKKNPLPEECRAELSALLNQLIGLIPAS